MLALRTLGLGRRGPPAAMRVPKARGVATGRAAMVRQSQPCFHGEYDSAGACAQPASRPAACLPPAAPLQRPRQPARRRWLLTTLPNHAPRGA